MLYIGVARLEYAENAMDNNRSLLKSAYSSGIVKNCLYGGAFDMRLKLFLGGRQVGPSMIGPIL